jgi:hypothetical protein
MGSWESANTLAANAAAAATTAAAVEAEADATASAAAENNGSAAADGHVKLTVPTDANTMVVSNCVSDDDCVVGNAAHLATSEGAQHGDGTPRFVTTRSRNQVTEV